VIVETVGGPEVLEVRDVPIPTPGPGQVLIKVLAAGVNFIDVYHRTGLYATDLALGLGVEGAGQVVELGPEVTKVSTGQQVGWISGCGSYSEYCLVTEADLIPLPEGTDPLVAAGLLLQGLTAHALVTSVYPVLDGDPVLIHAAAGGVGLLLTQIATLRGAVVHATVSSAEKEAAAQQAGARYVYGYEDVLSGVLTNTEKGVAVAYDGIGAPTVSTSLDCLRPRGMLVIYGAAGGLPLPFDLQRLNAQGSLFVTRPTVMEYTSRPGEREARVNELFDWMGSNLLALTIANTYSLEDAAQAHRDLQSRATIGKLILTP
jgi:NADPH2:quinone reductase